MTHHKHQINGIPVNAKHRQGMWRVTIGGKHYCAETHEALVRGLNATLPVDMGVPVPPKPERVLDEPPKPLEVIVQETKSIPKYVPVTLEDFCKELKVSTTLEAKQAALSTIMTFARNGNTLASLVVDSLSRQPISPAAQALADRFHKDFALLTHEEIVASVHDLILRGRLMTELGERLAFLNR